jgi:hypothetical protein
MINDPKPNLGAAALEANREYFANLRTKAYSEYIHWKRLELQTQEELDKLEFEDFNRE